jgi:hypothetical protein
MTQSDQPSKIVTNEQTRPCGCHIVEFADKTSQISPCAPCGLMDVARGLNLAASAMAAVATRLRMESGRAAVAEAARAVANNPKL